MAQLLKSMRATFLVIVIAIVIMQCTCGPSTTVKEEGFHTCHWIGLVSDYFTLTSCQELIKSMSKTWQIVASIHEVDGLKQSFVSCQFCFLCNWQTWYLHNEAHLFLGFLVSSWTVHSIFRWQYSYPALNFIQPHVNQLSSLNHQQTSNTLQCIISQNALVIETNCVIRSCSPGQAACPRFLWNPRELSFLHTQARCFHSSASFTVFFSLFAPCNGAITCC